MREKGRKNHLPEGSGNDAIVLLSSTSGRTVGFIVGLNSRGVPFDRLLSEHSHNQDLIDTLMDTSFLPFDVDEAGDFADEFDEDLFSGFYSLENKLRRSLQVRSLSAAQLSELEFFMRHIHMTEN